VIKSNYGAYMEITEINSILLLTTMLLVLVLLITCFGMLMYLIRVNRGMEALIAGMKRSRTGPVERSPEPGPQKDEGVPVTAPAPECHRDVDILENSSDIRQNMEALNKKYGLGSITLASPDGLVIASSDPDAQQIAARYSHMKKKGLKPEDARIQVFDMYYRGSPITGIIRVNHPLPASWLSSIEEDTRKILNWWLP
jgi:hypothetical protein